MKLILSVFVVLAISGVITVKGSSLVSPADILINTSDLKINEMRKIKYVKGEVVNGVKFVKEVYCHTEKRKAEFVCNYCGDIFVSDIQHVKCGHTASCGCYGKTACLTHGLSSNQDKDYHAWHGIKQRCYNKENAAFKNYGGRGIKMSDEFLGNMLLFKEYIMSLDNYRLIGMTLDRINNNGNYERGNLRWATRITQYMNSRKRYSISGYTGVKKTNQKWQSQITHNSNDAYLGVFGTKEAALDARNNYIIENNLPHFIQKI